MDFRSCQRCRPPYIIGWLLRILLLCRFLVETILIFLSALLKEMQPPLHLPGTRIALQSIAKMFIHCPRTFSQKSEAAQGSKKLTVYNYSVYSLQSHWWMLHWSFYLCLLIRVIQSQPLFLRLMQSNKTNKICSSLHDSVERTYSAPCHEEKWKSVPIKGFKSIELSNTPTHQSLLSTAITLSFIRAIMSFQINSTPSA